MVLMRWRRESMVRDVRLTSVMTFRRMARGKEY